MLQYSKFQNGDGSSNVTLFLNDQTYVATNQHPNWQSIVDGLQNDDASVAELFDVANTVAKRFNLLTDRISVANGRVYLDGDEVNNALTQQIVRFVDAGVEDWQPLVEFYDRLATNPNQESVEQLYRWLEAHDFTITSDGKFIGYKGVMREADGNLVSRNTGRAIVNGEVKEGRIPNNIGDVVEMPRSEVTFDPSNGCSTGLHVGTWDYASTWGDGTVLEVLVDPRDVVSVPTDCGSAKLRTCRYTVINVLTKAIQDVVTDSFDEDDEDWECGCSECLDY